nr:MTH1187 family thiamine-binding protein [Bacillus sp. FJAT-45350]
MIRGLSYQNGVFFIGKKHVACAYDDNGKISDWVKPIDGPTLFLMTKAIIISMPLWFKIISVLYLTLIFIPKLLVLFDITLFEWSGLPFYFLFYYMFGTHFIFPEKLRKYHGAEHKVFSDRGVKKRGRLYRIKRAAITNRNCSTNTVVLYFSLVIVGTLALLYNFSFFEALQWASYGSLLLVPIINTSLKFSLMKPVRNYILKTSYYLQEKVTTTEPDRKHLLTAIQSYRRLAEVEFPEHLVEPKRGKKEVKRMAIVDITIIPIGTNTPSVSDYVADIHKVLESYQDKITYRLTPMSTIIEGELPVLFEVIQAIHEAPFKAGVQRVATNIRIDDRRDKELKMDEKVATVEKKLATTTDDNAEQKSE